MLRSVFAHFGVRVLVMLAVFLPWYLLDWGWVVSSTAWATGTVLSPFYDITFAAGGTEVLVEGKPFFYAKECTYVDLFLACAPFAWRSGVEIAPNVRRLAALACVISLVNLVRVSGSVAASVEGVPWSLAHDLPDMLIYWPILGLILFSCGRRSGLGTGRPPEPRAVGGRAGPEKADRPAALVH